MEKALARKTACTTKVRAVFSAQSRYKPTTASWGIFFVRCSDTAVEPLCAVFRRRILNAAAACTRAPLRFARDGAYVLDLQKKRPAITPRKAQSRARTAGAARGLWPCRSASLRFLRAFNRTMHRKKFLRFFYEKSQIFCNKTAFPPLLWRDFSLRTARAAPGGHIF